MQMDLMMMRLYFFEYIVLAFIAAGYAWRAMMAGMSKRHHIHHQSVSNSAGKGVRTMKRLLALFTAAAFVLTLGVAFAQDKTGATAAPEKKEEKAPVKKKTGKKHGKKAAKKEAAKKEASAPAQAVPAK